MTQTLNQQTISNSLQANLNGDPVEDVIDLWDDLANSVVGSRLSSTAGKVDYDYDEAAINFASGGNIATKNDRIVFNLQKLHRIKANGKMRLHLHLWQPADINYQFTIQHRIQNNGVAKNTTWVTSVANFDGQITVGGELTDVKIFPYLADVNQIIKLVEVDLTGSSISATVQFRLARTDSLGGVIPVTFADAHVNMDQTLGSREEYTK